MIRSYINKYRIKQFESPFRKLTIADREWVTKLCEADTGIGSHIHFSTMITYQEMYKHDSFRAYSGCILKRPWIENGKLFCQYPIGASSNRKNAVKKIIQVYSHKVKEFVFLGLQEESLNELQELYAPYITKVLNDPDSQEYMLDVKEQLNLEGSCFANKRQKIRRFSRNNNWTYEKITSKNMQDCLDINDRWCNEYEDPAATERQRTELNVIFKYYSDLNYQGGLFRIDGVPVAFCIGAPFNDEIFMNITMKADSKYRDSTIAFLYEFMKQNCSSYRYANDSCDLGLPGLRTFKTNLHPTFMIPFYYVTLSNPLIHNNAI